MLRSRMVDLFFSSIAYTVSITYAARCLFSTKVNVQDTRRVFAADNGTTAMSEQEKSEKRNGGGQRDRERER